jgi:hypothetical protein
MLVVEQQNLDVQLFNEGSGQLLHKPEAAGFRLPCHETWTSSVNLLVGVATVLNPVLHTGIKNENGRGSCPIMSLPF